MLQITPTARTTKHARKPKAGRQLGEDRHKRLAAAVASIMRDGDPTAFVFEASCRYAIRSELCLGGWPWRDANMAAVEVVEAALRQLGAKRPTWAQGQPWYTEQALTRMDWGRCARCHGVLPPSDHHRKYCSTVCKDAASRVREYRDEDRSWEAQRKAIQELRMLQRMRTKAAARGAARH